MEVERCTVRHISPHFEDNTGLSWHSEERDSYNWNDSNKKQYKQGFFRTIPRNRHVFQMMKYLWFQILLPGKPEIRKLDKSCKRREESVGEYHELSTANAPLQTEAMTKPTNDCVKQKKPTESGATQNWTKEVVDSTSSMGIRSGVYEIEGKSSDTSFLHWYQM